MALALAAAALGLAGCGNDAQTLARQACGHVSRSLALYARAQRDPGPAGAAADRRQATEELSWPCRWPPRPTRPTRKWNPLMTTLRRAASTRRRNLVTALRAQCATASGRHATETGASTDDPRVDGATSPGAPAAPAPPSGRGPTLTMLGQMSGAR